MENLEAFKTKISWRLKFILEKNKVIKKAFPEGKL